PRPLLLLGFPKAGTGGIEDEKLRIAVTEPVIGVAKKLPVAVAGVASRDLMVGDRHVTRLFQPIEKIPAKGVVGFGVVFDQITGKQDELDVVMFIDSFDQSRQHLGLRRFWTVGLDFGVTENNETKAAVFRCRT